MNPTYEIVPFGKTHLLPARDLAKLHAELLPNSPIALLGPQFMRQFYYRVLPRENLILGAVAYVDCQPAGFIVATHNSSGFMHTALRRHWLYLIWIIGLSILQNPVKRLGAIWEAWQIMNHQPAEQGPAGAELLSFGVLPTYRTTKFIRQTGLQLPKDLLNTVLYQLTAQGESVIRAVVEKDNTPAKLFYHSLGWHIGRASVPGWRTPCVEFLWRA